MSECRFLVDWRGVLTCLNWARGGWAELESLARNSDFIQNLQNFVLLPFQHVLLCLWFCQPFDIVHVQPYSATLAQGGKGQESVLTRWAIPFSRD